MRGERRCGEYSWGVAKAGTVYFLRRKGEMVGLQEDDMMEKCEGLGRMAMIKIEEWEGDRRREMMLGMHRVSFKGHSGFHLMNRV